MQARDVLIANIELGNQLVIPLFEDLKDAPLERTLPEGGNHAHWMLGHLLLSEAQMCRVFAMGEENPYADWNSFFKGGTSADPEGKGYPPYEQLLEKYRHERAHTISILEGLSEADLDARPAIVKEEYEAFFPNKAAVFILNANHPFMHYGQLADIRRRLGRDILMA
ncbi:MAG: DinB family protein [Planctomycetaceae bacterium]|nr:DinB family protein [Planctomycetaceae bacterium]